MTHLLVIDDEEDYCYLVKRILEPAGFTIHTAADGTSGWAALEGRSWDGVILDINLPDQDGYGFCRQVRSTASRRDVPILFLTVRRRPEEWIQGFDAGADDYLTKPIIPEDLLTRVQHLVARRASRQTAVWARPEDGVVYVAQHGNRTAFETLFTHHRPRIFRFLLARSANPDVAEDLSAQTFAAAYQALPHFRRQAAFSTWLYRIAANLLCRHFRKVRTTEIPWDDLRHEQDDSEQDPITTTVTTGDDAHAVSTLQRLGTRQVLETLPAVYQQVLQLYEVEHCDYYEIANRLRCPRGTVMSRLHRARRLFRRRWQEAQDSTPPLRPKR